jgi:FKBP-type peptidyl-prolyl cis-trans isomerase (trigger factor)
VEDAAGDGDAGEDRPSRDGGLAFDDVVLEAHVSAQATPYYCWFEIPKEPLEEAMLREQRTRRLSWEALVAQIAREGSSQYRREAGALVRKYRRGKIPLVDLERLLTRENMYRDLLVSLLSKAVAQLGDDREVIHLQDLQLRGDGVREPYTVQAVVYFAPDVSVPDDFDPRGVDVEVVRLTDEELRQKVARKVEQICLLGRITSDKGEGTVVQEGDGALVTVVGVRDGARFEPACIRDHVVLTGENPQWNSPFKPYVQHVVGLRRGEQIKAEVEWDGEPMTIYVQVQQVLAVRSGTPEEIAVSRGFASVDAWSEKLLEAERRMALGDVRGQVRRAVEQKMQVIATVGAVPAKWLARRGEDTYEELLTRYGEEEALLESLGCSSREEGVQSVARQVLMEMNRRLLFRAYGARAGIEGYRNVSVNSLEPYIEKVVEWAVQNVRIEYVGTADIERRRQSFAASQ